jgi:two-component system, cell cycle sensor histidine kinase DivJ
VINLMTIQNKMICAITRSCTSWVSVQSHEAGTHNQDVKRIGFLFSIPFISLLNLMTTPVALSSTITALSLIALAFAVPVILATWLSLLRSDTLRRAVTILLPPIALLLVTQGHINTLSIAALWLVILATEATKKSFKRVDLAVSSVLTMTVASVASAASGSLLTEITVLLGLLPAMVTAAIYVAYVAKPLAIDNSLRSSSQFEFVSFLAQKTGMIALEIDRTACVHNTSGNIHDVLALEKVHIDGAAFLSRVHVADKVILLSALDSVANSRGSKQCKIRLQTDTSTHFNMNSSSNSKYWTEISCEIIAMDTTIFLMLGLARQPLSGLSAPAAGFGASALVVVSHELRTPLNAVIGFSDLMGKGMAGEIANERQREYIELINQSGHHLLQLVNSILDLSKLENDTYELEADKFLPGEAAGLAISMLAQQARIKNIGLNYLPLAGMDEFYGDKRVCQQIIINLLSNAVKFTPGHGQIHLSIEVENKRMSISVEDTGVGMSPTQLSMVGTPFYQASGNLSRTHEGAGLGLSLVRQMARLHGGGIEISSEPGKGTKVRVALASLEAAATSVSYLHPQKMDESARVILINEERYHGPLQKTA